MAKKEVEIIYYDYDTELDLLTHTEGAIPPLGSYIQVQETDIWYHVVNMGWRTGKGLEIGLRRVGCPLQP